jgi:uncharacterized GH25 family protein
MDTNHCRDHWKERRVKTPFGIIEFTHTKRTITKVFNGAIIIEGRPLPFAKVETVKRDLRRVGRNVEMMDEE